MLSPDQAKRNLIKVTPDVTPIEYVIYRDVYLFRVEFSSPSEKNYDPFFSVNTGTGEVRDFSVLTDGDISEISTLFLNKRNGGDKP